MAGLCNHNILKLSFLISKYTREPGVVSVPPNIFILVFRLYGIFLHIMHVSHIDTNFVHLNVYKFSDSFGWKNR